MSDEKTALSRLEAAQNRLEKLQRKLNFGTTITVVIAALLLALVAGYFYFGYQEISDLVEPENLVALGAVMVDDQVSQVRRTVQGEINKNAPVWAEQLSAQVVDSIPNMRESLEEYVLGQTDAIVQQLTGITESELRKFLQTDDEAMQTLLQELSSEKDLSDETMASLELAMDEALQANTEEQANLLLGTLFELRGKVDKLASGRGLNDEEALERHALMVVRRLQLEQGGESILNTIPPGLVTEPETSPQPLANPGGTQPDSAPAPEKKDTAPDPVSEEESDPESAPDAKSDPEPAADAKSDPAPAKEDKSDSEAESADAEGEPDAESK